MKKITIAIDGFSGTGKSSTAKKVAGELRYLYIDSGAMYRACTLYFLNHQVDLTSEEEVAKELENIEITFAEKDILLNGKVVSTEIRTMQVNNHVSQVSAISKVRQAMVSQQRVIGTQGGIVMDGRDIGTVVFPNADLKVFMSANSKVRAERRQAELNESGVFEELSVIEKNLVDRDKMDSSRKESPLIKSPEAVEIDTSEMKFDHQVSKIVELAKALIYES